MIAWINEWWSQVSGTVQHGVEITIVGMALVFFTLGLVILAMVLLTKLPWLRVREPSEETAQPTVSNLTPIPTTEPTVDADELARVAAIAVAMLRTRHTVRRHAPTRTARSAWKSYGRAEQLGL
jgi:Na+-transporting methylmalonyl-CoA/oxaloacetate decarboxylase gamma subunit